MSTGAPPSVVVCPRFNAPSPTTIAFVSRDHILFNIERAKLERASDFSPPASVVSTPSERVRLTESSRALELLFRYMDGDVNINLDACEFSTVYELAEAAQKYILFTAIPVCRQYLRHHYKDNALEVLQFAVKYNHVDIMALVAPHTIGEDISTMRDTLPGHLSIPWVELNDEYQRVARDTIADPVDRFQAHARREQDAGYCDLEDEAESTWTWLEREVGYTLLKTRGRALLDLNTLFTEEMRFRTRACSACRSVLDKWREDIEFSLSNIPLFSTHV
ncbi:hypothetical protein K525DRAFT_273208 [Schizophyllum commune Loenen D]|nr:hypothetical protein K525DRAFT_273208 [Schizophyllum commune Loenen D]